MEDDESVFLEGQEGKVKGKEEHPPSLHNTFMHPSMVKLAWTIDDLISNGTTFFCVVSGTLY